MGSTNPQTVHVEAARLASLDDCDILDTPPEERFDRITRLVTRVFAVPMSTVSLVDGHRQWFKSRQGIDACETSRTAAVCDHVIWRASPLIVPDTLADPVFASHPSVIGPPFVRFYAGVPVRAQDGQVLGTLCAVDTRPREFNDADLATLKDLSHIVEDELALRALATTDSLTGAMSRGAFRTEATRALALARRHRHPLGCVALDIDHFKGVNDRHGHAVGDRVLAGVVAACRAQLRESDLLGRVGGEEFAFILPHSDMNGALATAEKLRLAVAQLRLPTSGDAISVTASFGIATYRSDTASLDDLLAHADTALYEAKGQGRNRCCVWRGARETAPGAGKRRVLKAGQISFNYGRSVIDCTVRTLSDTGADLDVVTTDGIPDAFKLRIEADDLSRVCDVRARKDRRIEVAFSATPRAVAA